MKFVKIFLDDDGYEVHRVEYTKMEDIPNEDREIFMKIPKGTVRQVGDVIYEVY